MHVTKRKKHFKFLGFCSSVNAVISSGMWKCITGNLVPDVQRQHSDTVSHPTRSSTRNDTLFPLSTFVCYLGADQLTSLHKRAFRWPPDHCYNRTCPVTWWVYVSLLVRNSQFPWGVQRIATRCMHNLSILSGHITNNREEFWKFSTNTLIMNMSDHSITTNSEILSLILSLTHLVFQAYTCDTGQFHCKEWQKQASSVTELSVRTPVLD